MITTLDDFIPVAATPDAPIEVGVFCLPHAPKTLPTYATPGSAGLDLQAAIPEALTLAPMERRLIPTGLIIAIPEGYEAQLRPRSGLSIKFGITLINCVGTIDSDYRHELMVPLVNLSTEAYTVQPGDRIAQLLLAPVLRIAWQPVTSPEALPAVAQVGRAGGFGSTGL